MEYDYSKTDKVNNKNKLCLSFSKILCRILTFSFVLKLVCGLLILTYIFTYLYTETYIWQCNTLANILRPVKRTTCLINLTNRSNIIDKHKSDHNVSTYNIGIVMIYDRNYGNLDQTIVSRIIKNREYYCKLHGYSLIVSHAEEEEATVIRNNNNSYHNNSIGRIETKKENLVGIKRPAAWYKLTTMLKHLSSNKYDYLLYIDMDVVIMNYSISLESLIIQHSNQQVHDFIMTSDWSGLNTGIWIAKNSLFTKWFLRKAFEQTQLIQKYSKKGIPHPFEYEQRAFHYLLNTEVWQKRKLPTYDGNSTALQVHFQLLPQCALNSYVMHPLEFRGDREVSQYVDSDFLVHLAGKKGKIKSDLINYYLDIAEERRIDSNIPSRSNHQMIRYHHLRQ